MAGESVFTGHALGFDPGPGPDRWRHHDRPRPSPAWWVSRYGFSVAYLMLAAFAILGLLLWFVSAPKVAAAYKGD